MKIVFWIIGLIFTLISLPAYIAGIIMGMYREAYAAGAFRYKVINRWLNDLYNKSYGGKG